MVVSSTATVNPLAYPVESDFFPHGVGCVGFFDCQLDWVWSHHVTCWPLSVEPSLIAIGPPEGEEPFLAGNCCCGHPLDTVAVFNMFGVNTIPVIAAEKYSWGSIKGLYR